MIVLLILITFSLEWVLTLLGENWCWSLLKLKGLSGHLLSGQWSKSLKRKKFIVNETFIMQPPLSRMAIPRRVLLLSPLSRGHQELDNYLVWLCFKNNYDKGNSTIRVVTKISSCRVNTTSRRGIKQLGISFGSIFLLFSNKSSRGKFPAPSS